MGVDRNHRRLGLGRRLIAQAEEWVEASELLEWIDLQALSGNDKAIRLYELCGFKRTGEIRDMFRMDAQSFSYTAMAKKVRVASSDALYLPDAPSSK